MIVVDTGRGVVLRNDELKAEVAGRATVRRVAGGRSDQRSSSCDEAAGELGSRQQRPRATAMPTVAGPVRVKADPGVVGPAARLRLHRRRHPADRQPDGRRGEEPTWSMGDDAPLAVLSERTRPILAYFRQRFAQVTNPAIDSLRERQVMALDSFVGPTRQSAGGDPEQAQLVHLPSIALDDDCLASLRRPGTASLRRPPSRPFRGPG